MLENGRFFFQTNDFKLRFSRIIQCNSNETQPSDDPEPYGSPLTGLSSRKGAGATSNSGSAAGAAGRLRLIFYKLFVG